MIEKKYYKIRGGEAATLSDLFLSVDLALDVTLVAFEFVSLLPLP